MLQIKPKNIIPITQARAKLDDLVTQAIGNNFFVISRQGRAEAAIIDVDYILKLQQKLEMAEMRRLQQEFQKGFRNYLAKRGYEPDKLTEEEVEKILKKLTP